MRTFRNFVAVDWRAGKDKIYFFFKDTNTYSRFDIAQDKVDDGYPKPINEETWGRFHPFGKVLRFGFATAGIDITTPLDFDSDTLWLFFYRDNVPTVCKYDQDDDRTESITSVADSVWSPLLPYFDKIIAGTLNPTTLHPRRFNFLLEGGKLMILDLNRSKPASIQVLDRTLSGLAQYQHRIVTAVQNDRTLGDSHYYVFLTHNQYMRYNLPTHSLLAGPMDITETNWPGLELGY